MAKRPILIRLPISHYCKKVEWAMTHAGMRYDARDVWFGSLVDFHHVNPANTVPVLEVDDRLLCGSHAILEWLHEQKPAAGLYPEPAVAEHEAWADDKLGPWVRREAYRVIYARPQHWTENPLIWLAGFAGRKLVLKILKAYRARRFEERDRADAGLLLRRAADRLRDGQPFLFGDWPTAADFAQAALLEPLLRIRRHTLHQHPDWDILVAHMERVRPGHTLRGRTRRASKTDHARWTAMDKVPA